MPKYKIYTIIALVIMTIGFTIPVLGFYGISNKIKSNEITSGEQIPSYSHILWNLYTKIQYKNHLLKDDVKNDLNKMMEVKAEVSVPSLPVWYISLEAPNYPKEAFPDGIPIYVHVDGFGGDVHEMNTLNHYIGMFPVERGGVFEHSMSPYYLIIATIGMLLFLYYDGKGNSLLMILPAIAPIIFLACYVGWLYWFGHNLQDWGAFKIKPFMPTAFGDGKVAQFTTHSYPTIGFYMMIILSAFSLLAIFSKKKYLKEK
ncbi:MAG: cytochrome C [Campylobacter sputorum]|uniref:cytochrome C n=1 Tax=Campylobacter sputorum TaxID=206 RepID=UPI000B7959F2|nr:cytochrome C [Campylobacter sputorum]ASM38093.1 putative membrane protein [Campylobacter sputorum bv. paraureolyticus LMG 11764]MDY6121241.1 cytochrome C [Campylobacter sputorum]